MFKECLSYFSINALKSLAGQDALSFFESTLSIDKSYYDDNNQHELLIEAITNSSPLKILQSKTTRDYFIDRLRKDHLGEIYFLMTGEYQDHIYKSHYHTLKEKCCHPEVLKLFIEALGFKLDTKIKSKNNNGSFNIIKPSYGLYPYQVEISKKVFNSIDFGSNNRAIIHLPTGAGKTRTAMHIVCRHLMTKEDALVLWLANSEILCDQASGEFEKAWGTLGNRDIIHGNFFGDKIFSLESINSGFVVAGLQKLISYYQSMSANQTAVFDRKITLVIFDEAHRALATTYKEILERFLEFSPQAKLVGLTATPGRVYKDDKPELDPENKALAELFGNNKITMDVSPQQPMEYLIDKNYLAEPRFIELKYDDIDIYEKFNRGQSVSESELLKKLSGSSNRNSIILKTALNEVKNNNSKVIIFACDIEHARNLAFSLCCMGVKAVSIDSKSTNAEEKAQLINDYKFGDLNVLVNCEILTTGFDAPETNVAIIARPTNSLVLYLQMIGRALRGSPFLKPKKASIYTVLDEISDFNNVNLAFKHWNEMWTELKN
ncbi:DEAD/DEAH box helicase [Pseudoalteromonas ruthenica]|uniref:DEAD/DEAH box helicase n=1 Tax=Pseudoalteromonas ruthenica TaxID=151081 RepID=UPI00110A31C2|nr:DEAD/DEAH box helicase [Pseudoalteromonas ruthenica]TMO90389.1 ATP-dependent helicase [Pseudoalteromonas ruthenica]TMP23540.1 ATP-dependent helicase [Pseudoalteromonas ruthenica]